MASCINPRYFRYRDAFSGEAKTVAVRCGKCNNCIAADQDSWSVRLSESCIRSKHFIYTTLTFRPCGIAKLPVLDISDALVNPDFFILDASTHYLDYWSERLGFGCLPLFEKKILSDWIKRGRENYYADTGERLHFKYIFCSELGPQNARPHAHGIIIGLDPLIYYQYFVKPWYRDYGWVDRQYIHRNPRYVRSCIAVSHYISKYINKGSHENALILNELYPRCWRMVSNGIGEELLENPKYDVFRTEKVSQLLNTARRHTFKLARLRTRTPEGDERIETPLDKLHNYRDLVYWTADPALYIGSVLRDPLSVLPFGMETIKRLVIYTDDNSYMHSLPRYYRYKLMGRDPNLFKFAVQTALLQDAEQRYNSDVQRLASSLEGSVLCRERSYNYASVHKCAVDLARYFLAITEKEKALRSEERYNITLNNHYKRPRQYNGTRNIVLLQ